MGAGLAIGMMGAAAQGWAYRDFRAYDRRLEADCGGGCFDAQMPSLSRMRVWGERKQRVAWVTYGLATAVVISGGIFVYLNQPRFIQRKVKKSVHISIVPTLSPRDIGVSATLRL